MGDSEIRMVSPQVHSACTRARTKAVIVRVALLAQCPGYSRMYGSRRTCRVGDDNAMKNLTFLVWVGVACIFPPKNFTSP